MIIFDNLNTLYDKVPERPNMLYIFEERIVQGYQNDIPMSQIGEYKNINLLFTHVTGRSQYFPVTRQN